MSFICFNKAFSVCRQAHAQVPASMSKVPQPKQWNNMSHLEQTQVSFFFDELTGFLRKKYLKK